MDEIRQRRIELQKKLYGSTLWDFSAPYDYICLGDTCPEYNTEGVDLSDNITEALKREGCNFIIVEGDQRLGKSVEVAKAVADLGYSGKRVMVVYGRDELTGEPHSDGRIMTSLGLEASYNEISNYFDPEYGGIPEYMLDGINKNTVVVLNEATNPFIQKMLNTGINLFCIPGEDKKDNYYERLALTNNYLLNYWKETYFPNIIAPILARGGKIVFITPYQFAPLVRTTLSAVMKSCAQHVIEASLSKEIPVFTVNRWTNEQLAKLIDNVFDFEGVADMEKKKAQLVRLCKGSPWLINELAGVINNHGVLNKPIKIKGSFIHIKGIKNPIPNNFITTTCYNTLKLYNLLIGEFILEENEYPTASQLKTKLLEFRQEIIDFFACPEDYEDLWELTYALFEQFYKANANTQAVLDCTQTMLTLMESCSRVK